MGFRSRSIFARLLIKKFILTNSVLGQGCLVWSDQSLCLIVRKSGIYLSKLRRMDEDPRNTSSSLAGKDDRRRQDATKNRA